jgi:hypothetical protein
LSVKLSLTSLLLGAGLLLATACDRPELVPPPPNLLSKEELTSLLIRLHVLEARIESSRLAPDSARALFLHQRRQILGHYKLAEADSAFERSYHYYSIHGKDLDEIYAAIIDSLAAREKKMGGNPTPLH